MTRKVMFAIDGRANWATMHSVIRECVQTGLDTVLLCYAGAVSDRHGDVSQWATDKLLNVIRMPTLVEGGPGAMAATAGLTASSAAVVLEREQPDVVVVCGDRYSVLPIAMAASYMNIIVAHVMGGEVSGTIDEGVRHAITQLAHIHFPATEGARQRLLSMGQNRERVHRVGCPRIDFVRAALVSDRPEYERRCLLVSQHSVTTEYARAYEQMKATLEAVDGCDAKEIHLVWPSSDAGSQAVVEAVRERHSTYRTHRALPPEDYAILMARCGVIVGNSSSAIREGAWIGTPAVNVGTRQRNRERGANVIDVGHTRDEIRAAIHKQLNHGQYDSDILYGDGLAGRRIAEILSGPLPGAQKTWCDAS